MTYQPISISLDYVNDNLKAKASLAMEEMNEYLTSECLFKKSELIETIREKTGLHLTELECFLYESWRTMIRLQKLKTLIPELKVMYMKKQIAVEIIYVASNLTVGEQYDIYEVLQLELENSEKELQELKEKKRCIRSTKKYSKVTYTRFAVLKEELFHESFTESFADFHFK